MTTSNRTHESAITRRAALAGGATVVAGAAALPAIASATDADAALVAAAREMAQLRAQIHNRPPGMTIEEEVRYEDITEAALWDRYWTLNDWIAETPAQGLEGAVIKLRLLADPDIGINIGPRGSDMAMLTSALATVERLAGRVS